MEKMNVNVEYRLMPWVTFFVIVCIGNEFEKDRIFK